MSLSDESKQYFAMALMEMQQELSEQVRMQHELTREKLYGGDLGDFANTDMAADNAHMLCDRLRERLLLIDEALESLENGDYGLCEECEDQINEQRLKLMPFARLCVHCQSTQEKQARLRGGAPA